MENRPDYMDKPQVYRDDSYFYLDTIGYESYMQGMQKKIKKIDEVEKELAKNTANDIIQEEKITDNTGKIINNTEAIQENKTEHGSDLIKVKEITKCLSNRLDEEIEIRCCSDSKLKCMIHKLAKHQEEDVQKLQEKDKELAEAIEKIKKGADCKCADIKEELEYEINERKKADEELEELIKGITPSGGTYEKLIKALADEIKAREDADSKLESALNDEKTAREQKDNELESGLTSLSSRVTECENAIVVIDFATASAFNELKDAILQIDEVTASASADLDKRLYKIESRKDDLEKKLEEAVNKLQGEIDEIKGKLEIANIASYALNDLALHVVDLETPQVSTFSLNTPELYGASYDNNMLDTQTDISNNDNETTFDNTAIIELNETIKRLEDTILNLTNRIIALETKKTTRKKNTSKE